MTFVVVHAYSKVPPFRESVRTYNWIALLPGAFRLFSLVVFVL